MNREASSNSSPVISMGYSSEWKVSSLFITSILVSFSLYYLFFSGWNFSTYGDISVVLSLFIFPSSAYAVFSLDLRVYSDRVERERFRTKEVRYEDVERVHLADWAAQRVTVYEKGASNYPAIGIHTSLEDWRALAKTLLEEIPDTVKITGSEELKSELVNA